MLFTNRYCNLKLILFVLVMLSGCRSEQVAFRFQPAASEQLVETVDGQLPTVSSAICFEAQPVAKPLATRLQVFSRPLAHRPAARVRHEPARLRLAYLGNSKTIRVRSEPTTLASRPSGNKFSDVLFVGGFVVALPGLLAAFAMPTFGLSILVFLGGLLLGFIITGLGFVTGYGSGQGVLH